MSNPGAPTKYKEEYCDKVNEYLSECKDEDVRVLKQANEEKGYEIYDTKLKVSLPTIEGFAQYIDVNKTTLYEWEKVHPEFSNALEKIRNEQHKRLINSGLSGDYQPTIAKLILSSNHGMAERSEVSGKDGGPIEISELSNLSDEELLELTNRSKKGTGKKGTSEKEV